jgi:hypothetical protein
MDGYCIVCIKSKDGMNYFWSLDVVGCLHTFNFLIDTQVKCYEQAYQRRSSVRIVRFIVSSVQLYDTYLKEK